MNYPEGFLKRLTAQAGKGAAVLIFITNPFLHANAQSIEVGAKGGLGTALFLNGNLLKGGTDQHYDFSLSHSEGVHGAINFQHGCGLELEVLSGTLSQAYAGTFTRYGVLATNNTDYYPGESYSSKTEIGFIQIPVLFRYEHDVNGKYFEAGLSYEIINSASYSATYNSNPPFSESYDVTDLYPSSNFLAIVGMGWDKRMSHESNFYFNFGFRLTYGLFDLGGVDGHGQALLGPNSVILYEQQPKAYYPTYSPTHSLDLSANVGLFYRFYPKAMMHKRKIDF